MFGTAIRMILTILVAIVVTMGQVVGMLWDVVYNTYTTLQ